MTNLIILNLTIIEYYVEGKYLNTVLKKIDKCLFSNFMFHIWGFWDLIYGVFIANRTTNCPNLNKIGTLRVIINSEPPKLIRKFVEHAFRGSSPIIVSDRPNTWFGNAHFLNQIFIELNLQRVHMIAKHTDSKKQ